MILEDEQNQPQFTNHRFLMILKVKRCPILRHSLQAPNHNTNPPPPTLFPLKQYTPFTVYILFLSISLPPSIPSFLSSVSLLLLLLFLVSQAF